MTVAAKMKGQIKETTGKLTGDTGMEAEGKFEKGVAEVKRADRGSLRSFVALASAFFFIRFPNPSVTLFFVILAEFVDHPPHGRCDRGGYSAIQDDTSDNGNRERNRQLALRSVVYP